MRTIETDAIVTEHGKMLLNIKLPDLSAGKYKIVMIIDDKIEHYASPGKASLKFNIFEWTNWPGDSTFRREDIYNDDGR